MAFFILSQIAVGIILILLTIPLEKVGRGFFAFHAWLALALEAVALALDRTQLAAHAPFAVLLLILVALFQLRKLRRTRMVMIGAAICGVAALAAGAARLGNTPAAAISGTLVILSSALVLGSILIAMNLGHWYLVIKGLPFELLGAANRTFIRSLVLRIACIAAGGMLAFDSWKGLLTRESGPLWDTALFMTVRLAFGLAAPLLLAWMVHECVKIQSNQSATGILYVALVFVLIGELSGLYFLLERGVPL